MTTLDVEFVAHELAWPQSRRFYVCLRLSKFFLITTNGKSIDNERHSDSGRARRGGGGE